MGTREKMPNLASEHAEDALDALPAARNGRIEDFGFGFAKIQLHEDAHAMRASAPGPDGIDSITVANHEFPGRCFVKNTRPNAGMPVSRLFHAVQVSYAGGSSGDINIPTLLGIERHLVVRAEKDVLSGADFLVIVAGEGERKFGDQRQERSQAIGAETIRFEARSGAQADVEIMFQL